MRRLWRGGDRRRVCLSPRRGESGGDRGGRADDTESERLDEDTAEQILAVPAARHVDRATEHERDAAESARVMWAHRTSFATLTAALDPTTRIEGDVWLPP